MVGNQFTKVSTISAKNCSLGYESVGAMQTSCSDRHANILFCFTWQAARGGHTDVVEFLTDQGADLNAKTAGGASVLDIVADYFGEDDTLYEYLVAHGALEAGPEL